MQLALKAFRERNLRNYRNMLSVTVLLGIGFIIFQLFGFSTIWKTGVTFNGSGAGQFLYVIAGLHLLHVIGGIIALIAMNIRAFNRQVRNYNVTPVEVVATYWHFVDFLWIYLFIFFIIMR
jgi:cytochrome c oxidase subunit 3